MHILLVRNCVLSAHPTEDPERIVLALAKALQRLGHRITCLVQKGSECPYGQVLFINPALPLEEQIPENIDLVHFHCRNPMSMERPHLSTVYDNLPPCLPCTPNTVFVSAAQATLHGGRVYVQPGLNWDEIVVSALGQSRSYCHFLGDASWPERNVRSAIDIAGKAGVRLHVIGGARINFRKELRITISPFVRFHGSLQVEGIHALLNQSQALLHPIRWPEPFSLAAIESLYFGCPVIGTPLGVLPELISPGGAINRPDEHAHGTVDAVYSNWGCLSMKTSELTEAVRNVRAFDAHLCHDYAQTTFAAQRMAADYVALYEQVLNGHPLHADAPKGIPEGVLQTLPEMEA